MILLECGLFSAASGLRFSVRIQKIKPSTKHWVSLVSALALESYSDYCCREVGREQWRP